MGHKKSILQYLIISIILEFLLFIPLYISRADEGNFWPRVDSLPESMISRANPDIFRWCLELGFMLSLYLFISIKIKSIWLELTLAMIYFFMLLFQSYYFILWKIYGEIPIFSYDWALFERVLPVFMKTMHIPPILFNSLLVCIAFLLVYLLFRIFRYTRFSIEKISSGDKFVYFCIVFLIPACLKTLIPHEKESNNTKSAIVWLIENIHQTSTGSRVHSLPDVINFEPYQSYYSLPLKSKPNILLIFIEAYGSVLGCVSPYDMEYTNHLKKIESNLTLSGWKSASTFSNSTVLGGRSWLGFTSLLAGIKIDNHLAYEKLIKLNTNYPHLINTLNTQGYSTYRLNTLSNFGEDFKTIDSIAGNFFNVNSAWTKFNNIPYQGYRYDYFGGVPDQYALNYWDETVLNKFKQPYFLFFITLNTHAPFYLPPPLVANWKDLDAIKTSPHRKVRAESGKPIDRYAKGVHYILSTLEQYILNKADSNTLILLIGDHQPAGMEYMIKGKTDLYANPFHIISKDERWISLFIDKGFQPGMVPKLQKPSLLNHQEIYSFFMNIWAKRDSIDIKSESLKDGLRY